MDHPSQDLLRLRDFLHEHLTGDIIPFWLEHGVDPDGGINTCMRDDGSLVSRDKWQWSQWRAVWVFSKLYNEIEAKAEWLDFAEHIYRFNVHNGWDADAKAYVLCLGHDGQVLRGYESVYADGFAIYGMTEYAKASGLSEPLELARRTADCVLERLRSPHDKIPHFPYPIPKGARVHGIPMIFALVLWELGQFTDEDRYREAALAMCDDIFAHFYRADRDLVLERIAVDNSEFPAPLGTAVVPGHVIEDMWFQIHIARDCGNRERIAEACRLTRRHLEFGWDSELGGLLLARDADGRDEVGWEHHDTKLWWPHTEMLYATLIAYEHTREPWCLEWYDKTHDYSFSHYPNQDHGGWTQRLDRHGKPFTGTVALPVKDPFHLPRALIYCLDVLDRLTAEQP